MIRFGAHAFTWVSDWTEENARLVATSAKEAGLQTMEIPLLRPREFDAGFVKELLAEHGLEATYSLGLPVDERLPDYPDRAASFLRTVIDNIVTAGGSMLSGVIYGTLGELPGHPPKEEEYRQIASTLKEVATYAADQGVSLGIEPVNRYETYLVNTMQQAVDLIERIGEDNVFIHLDTYHANIEEKGFAEPIRQAGSLVQYVHLSESDRGTPGTGNVHWDEVFEGLRDIGFSGHLVMESFVAPHPDIARATCMWRNVAPSSDILIRDGLSFLRSKGKEYGLL